MEAGRIEVALRCLKREGFRFIQSVQQEKKRLGVLQPLLDLVLIYQLLAYSLIDIVQGFSSNQIVDLAKTAIQIGLTMCQQNSYSGSFHLAVGIVGLSLCGIFLIQMIRGRWSMNVPAWQKLQETLMLLATVAVWIAPAYYLAAPMHLHSMFTNSSTESVFNFVLLPFYVLFLATSLVLNRRDSLLTVFHLFIPLSSILKLHRQLNNLIIATAFGLALGLLSIPMKSVTIGFSFIILNLWAIIEMDLSQYSPSEGLFGLVLWLFTLIACIFYTTNPSAEQTPVDDAILLENLIEMYEKPTSTQKQFRAECVFIDHFMKCSCANNTASFCGGCKFNGKSLMQLPKESLCELFQQKIVQDSKDPKWALRLTTQLMKFRFVRNKNRLKLYREYWKESLVEKGTPLEEQYEKFKTLRAMRRILKKETHGNISIFSKLTRLSQEEELCVLVQRQLYNLERFWAHLESRVEGDNIQPQLANVVACNSTLQERHRTLTSVQPLSQEHSLLFRLYSSLINPQAELQPEQEIMQSSRQLQPVFLVTDSEKVFATSRKFLQLYHFTAEEIIGRPIINLLPQPMHSLHQQKINEWSGVEIIAPLLKLLITGEGFIETFHFSLQIYPDLEKGLRYVGFLQPHDNSQHFLYNVKDDYFLGVSKRLTKTLKQLGCQMQGQEGRRYKCQQVFEGLNLKNIPTLEQLKAHTITRQLVSSRQQIQLKMLREYRIGSTLHLMLIQFGSNNPALANDSKYPQAVTEQVRPCTESLGLQEKVAEAKNSTYKRSRLSRFLLVQGLSLLLLLVAYFVYRYGVSATRLTAFQTSINQTTRCLITRQYFAEFTLKSLQIYTVGQVPSTLAPATQTQMLQSYQAKAAKLITSLNQVIMQKLSSSVHYDIYRTAIAINQNIAVNQVAQIKNNIYKIRDLIGINFNRYSNGASAQQQWIEIGLLLALSVIHLLVSLSLSVRTETLLDALKKMYTEVGSAYIQNKKKQLNRVMKSFVDKEGELTKKEKVFEAISQQVQPKQPKLDKPSSNSLKRVLFNMVSPIVLCASFVGLAAYLWSAFSKIERDKEVISKIQINVYSPSIAMLKLGMFTYLRFTESSLGGTSSLLLADELRGLNIVQPDKYIVMSQIPDGFSIPNEWRTANQDMCSFVYSDPTELSKCYLLSSAVGKYGYRKSLIRLQQHIMNVVSQPIITSRYESGQLQTATHLCLLLSKYSEKMYWQYLKYVDRYVNYINVENNTKLLLMMLFIVLFCGLAWLDYQLKQSRIEMLKELFRMLPDQLFMEDRTVRLFFGQENLLEALKKL